MAIESSAGGIVFRPSDSGYEIAVIRPHGKDLWALPKGHVDKGETPEQAAGREVTEETGVSASLVKPLGEIRYFYQFRGKKIFKQVQFFLFEYRGGEINQLDEKMRIEVDQARWMPLNEALRALAYKGEREMVEKAMRFLEATTAPLRQ
jgi:8-oxo-dGTP pyrophosphatase MutT (NUDIX family)